MPLGDELMHVARQNILARRLMTLPGVGPLVALNFIATVDDASCFRRSRDVGAFLGLTPRRSIARLCCNVLDDASQAVLPSQGLCDPAQRTERLQEGCPGYRAQIRRYSPRHLARWNRVQLDKGARDLTNRIPAQG